MVEHQVCLSDFWGTLGELTPSIKPMDAQNCNIAVQRWNCVEVSRVL